MKLKQLFFNKTKLSKEDEKKFAVLDHYVDCVFDVNENEIAKNLRKVNLADKDRDQVNRYARYAHLDAYDLQFHTRDNEWLTIYARHVINYVIDARARLNIQPLEDSGMKNFTMADIEKYVTLSPKFDQVRTQFEQKMTKACIDMHKNGHQDFLSDANKLNEDRQSAGYDILFRERVVEAMTALGVAEKSVNVALELNRDAWLPFARHQAFENAKEKDFTARESQILEKDSPLDLSLLNYIEKQLFASWNALRDRQYYQVHKDVIDELNLATPNMKINTKKQNQLMQEVDALGHIYKQRARTCHMLVDIAQRKDGAINEQGYIIANHDYKPNDEFTLG